MRSCSSRSVQFPNGQFTLESMYVLTRHLTHHSFLETAANTLSLSHSEPSDTQLKDTSRANEDEYRFSSLTCSHHYLKRNIKQIFPVWNERIPYLLSTVIYLCGIVCCILCCLTYNSPRASQVHEYYCHKMPQMLLIKKTCFLCRNA